MLCLLSLVFDAQVMVQSNPIQYTITGLNPLSPIKQKHN